MKGEGFHTREESRDPKGKKTMKVLHGSNCWWTWRGFSMAVFLPHCFIFNWPYSWQIQKWFKL